MNPSITVPSVSIDWKKVTTLVSKVFRRQFHTAFLRDVWEGRVRGFGESENEKILDALETIIGERSPCRLSLDTISNRCDDGVPYENCVA